jgi:thiol-disulfide isomerase/thioredoxin
MGRLPALTVVFVLATAMAGCERSTTPAASDPPPNRSEAIAVASSMPIAKESPSAAPSAPAAHGEAKPRRKLCEQELGQPGKKYPKASFRPVAAAGAKAPADDIAVGTGKWTWINFFAAWCGPCKEEIPRLLGFQQKLASRLEVSFVSLDDDERQLRQFLAGQPESGIRSALWIEPGKARTTWLSALNMKDSPDLPAHVLVDGTGKVRCVVGGAIDDADFPTIAAMVGVRQ